MKSMDATIHFKFFCHFCIQRGYAASHYSHAYTCMLDSSLAVSVYFRAGCPRLDLTASQPWTFSNKLDLILHPWRFFTMNNLQYTVWRFSTYAHNGKVPFSSLLNDPFSSLTTTAKLKLIGLLFLILTYFWDLLYIQYTSAQVVCHWNFVSEKFILEEKIFNKSFGPWNIFSVCFGPHLKNLLQSLICLIIPPEVIDFKYSVQKKCLQFLHTSSM